MRRRFYMYRRRKKGGKGKKVEGVFLGVLDVVREWEAHLSGHTAHTYMHICLQNIVFWFRVHPSSITRQSAYYSGTSIRGTSREKEKKVPFEVWVPVAKWHVAAYTRVLTAMFTVLHWTSHRMRSWDTFFLFTVHDPACNSVGRSGKLYMWIVR